MSEGQGFSDLVQRAGRLTTEMDTSSELPRVERNLRQLLEAGQQLWARTAQTGAQDVKASILLGAKGVDLPSISQRLESLDASRTFQPLEPVKDTDIAGFLRNERENAVLTVIEESRKQTFDQVDRFHWESFQSCWEMEKQRILSTLATSGPDMLDVTIQPELSVTTDEAAPAGRSSLSAQELAYAETVADYIERLSQGDRKPDLVSACRQLMVDLSDDVAVELWDTVRCVTEVQVRSHVDRFSASVQAALIRQAKRYLEASHLARVKRLVFSSLSSACLGGVPGTRQLVQSYLAVRPPSGATDDTLVDGQPVWPLIFHCLRCGDPEAAQQVAAKAGAPLQDVARLLGELARSRDGCLTAESEAAVRLQFRRSSAAGTDPYRRAVYTALGAADLCDDHTDITSDILPSTDDFLWLKLSGLSMLSGDAQLSALAHLQTTLLEEYGESHFDAYNQPTLYFRVLLLTGQLEAAVEFLARVERLRPHAVHIALALHELSLLQLPGSTQAALLTRDPAQPARRQLNLARLVLMYTRRFEAAEPQAALHYLFLLRHLRLDDGGDLFAAATAELVLQSGSHRLLLGSMATDGTRQRGALDRYNFDPRPVIERVAAESEARGQLEDAVHLYDLANNHDKVLELLNLLLSQLVPRQAAPGSRRQRLQEVAIGIAKRFKECGTTASPEAAGTLYLLLDLMSFFDLYHLGRREEALAVVRRLRLVALHQEELERRLADFGRLQEEVRRCVPDLLVATMTLLHEVKLSPGGARQMARTLITFAGSLPYRLPGDTHARLVQLEVLMS